MMIRSHGQEIMYNEATIISWNVKFYGVLSLKWNSFYTLYIQSYRVYIKNLCCVIYSMLKQVFEITPYISQISRPASGLGVQSS